MSQNASSNKKPTNRQELLQIAAKPVFFLLLLIMVCAFLAHYLIGSETLEQYANDNPEAAYGSDAEIPNADSSDTKSDSTDYMTDLNGAKTSDFVASVEDTTDLSPAYNISESEAGEISKNAAGNAPEVRTPISPAVSDEEDETMTADTNRITYQDGFYYEPLTDSVKERITGISYPRTGCTVPYEDLNYVGVLYVDFDGEVQDGELICNKAIAQDMVEIFYELYRNDYRIERVRLIDEYGGDDTLSMLDNNTSCFNYRVVDGTTTLSKHALGCAIDINPFYNPYIVFNKNGSGETYISPKGSEIYADRSQSFPYKIDERDLCYKLFTEHGFTWGGNWNSTKDYQHFQIVLP